MTERPYPFGDWDARHAWLQSLFPRYRFRSCPLVDTIAGYNAAWELIVEVRRHRFSRPISGETYRDMRRMLFRCRRRFVELTPDHQLDPGELRAALKAMRRDMVEITLHDLAQRRAA